MVKKGLFGGSSNGKLLMKRPFSRKRVPDPQFRGFYPEKGSFGTPKRSKPTRPGPRDHGVGGPLPAA